jgi:hypothetical protein
VALALAAAFTLTSWFGVERPFLRWKDRLERRGEPVAAARPAPEPALN